MEPIVKIQEIVEEMKEGDVVICDGLLTGKVGKVIGMGSSEHSIKLLVDGVERYEPDYALMYITNQNKKALALLVLHTTTAQRVREETIEEVKRQVEEMRKPEKEIECCENCNEEGYGRAWYGRGRETGDSWGDRYVPTGSVVFCKECKPNFRIGQEWNGEEIWKTTSDSPEHEQLRISRITKTVNVEHNQTLDSVLSTLNK